MDPTLPCTSQEGCGERGPAPPITGATEGRNKPKKLGRAPEGRVSPVTLRRTWCLDVLLMGRQHVSRQATEWSAGYTFLNVT